METALPDSTGRSVYDVLSASRAMLERSCALGDGLRLAQWHNHDDSPRYAEPGHHTVSVYLAGGFGTYAAHRPELRGSPGRICILPAEHESRWIVEGDLRFLHLYVSDLAWAERVVRLIDAEPRAVTLEERILEEDAHLAQWARLLADEHWASADSLLLMNSASHAALDRLVLAAARPAHRNAALRPRGTVGHGAASGGRLDRGALVRAFHARRSRCAGGAIGVPFRPHVPRVDGRHAPRLGRPATFRARMQPAFPAFLRTTPTRPCCGRLRLRERQPP